MKTIIQISKKMKTVKEASQELEFNTGLIHSNPRLMCERSFDSGVEFAQRWIPIIVDRDGFVNWEKSELDCNIAVLLKRSDEDNDVIYDWAYGIAKDKDLRIDGKTAEYWRPIDLK